MEKLTDEERNKLSEVWLDLDRTLLRIRDVLNTSKSIKANEKLRSIYGQIQKQKSKLPNIVENN